MKLYSLLKRSRVASAYGETYNRGPPRSAVAVLRPPRASANRSLLLNNVHTNLWYVITHRLRSAQIETNGTHGEFILFAVALVIEKIISSLRANKTPFNATPFISTTFLSPFSLKTSQIVQMNWPWLLSYVTNLQYVPSHVILELKLYLYN